MKRLGLAFVVWLIPTWAYAANGILLFESDVGREGLCAAVRIQMADVGAVTCVTTPLPDDTAARIERVSLEVRQRGALIGLIVEPDKNPKVLRMVIVGARPDQAVIAVERVENRGGPDVDRALALKAREAHDVVSVAEQTNAAEVTPLPAMLAQAPQKPAEKSSKLTAIVGLAGGVSTGPSTIAVVSALLGLARERDTLRLEAALQGAYLSEQEAQNQTARVTVGEYDLGVVGRALYRRENLAFGGSVGLSAAILDVLGEDLPMRRRSVLLVSPHASLGLDARLCLWDRIWVRFAPELDLALRRERLAVASTVLEDRGRVRAVLLLGLLLEVP